MVKIVWTEIALNDLKGIFDYISVNSRRYASLTASKIYNKIQLLLINPRMGRVVPELKNNQIRELIEGNYRIIYLLKSPERIDILRIHHSSRRLNKPRFH